MNIQWTKGLKGEDKKRRVRSIKMDSDIYRGYRVTPLGTFATFKIQAQGSGTIPNDLIGTFTTTREAYLAIDRSLSKVTKKGRGKTNGKETSTSSGK